MPTAYIGLGSNLGESLATLRSAIQHLNQHPDIQVTHTSRFYSSKPVGPQDQPDYTNAALVIETQLEAQALLAVMLQVEREHGRDRQQAVRWGARTLDLDLLLYGQTIVQTESLTVPHPYLHERAFVVYPLMDVAPDLVLPNGTGLQHYYDRLSGEDLIIIEE